MVHQRFEAIQAIVSGFTGRSGEPNGEQETYLLLSMWVMMLSEFEGMTKTLVEDFLDEIKEKPIEEIHVCLLLTHFHGNSTDPITLNTIRKVFCNPPKDISYRYFTEDQKPKITYEAVKKLFNSLGIFFSNMEDTELKSLKSISTTRNAIAHGDRSIAITKHELENKLEKLSNIFSMLENKIH